MRAARRPWAAERLGEPLQVEPARAQAQQAYFDVVTANNPGAYRDMWALRSSALYMNYDCFWDFTQMRHEGNCKQHRIYVHREAPSLAVEAAFNGMAIYSAAALRRDTAASCRYTNESADPDSGRRHVVSEHVPFQRCLADHGVTIGLWPSLQTYCHDWSTRHDARRTFYLRNGTVVRLRSRHARADPRWTH